MRLRHASNLTQGNVTSSTLIDQYPIPPHDGAMKNQQPPRQYASQRSASTPRRQSSRSSDPAYPPPTQYAPQSHFDPGQQLDPFNPYSMLDPRSSPQRFAPPHPASPAPPPSMFAVASSPQYGYQPYFPHPHQNSQHSTSFQPSPYTPYYPQLAGQSREDSTSTASGAGALVYGSDGSPILGHDPLMNHISFQSSFPGSPSFHHFASPASSVYSPYATYEPTFTQTHDQHNPLPPHPPTNTFPPFTDPASYPSSTHSRWSSAGSHRPYPNPPYLPLPFQPNLPPQSSYFGPYNALLHSPPPPLPYQPPFEAEPTRGKFAQVRAWRWALRPVADFAEFQVNFRQALEHGVGAGGGPPRRRSQGPRSTLPKPPAHSPHALW